ncbi:oligopeptidase A [Pantoea sp. Mhis]|uniref:oligopeptidase A n=1 Tax=Pantoea sp. Mhis TaxID=2576759 RepID=UPI001357B6A6|nr:oligopeptidase A [Pantoea sp. Mhis]MXP56730.1 oligopeptidase A [Pantoea sp. Mhis]
MNNPLLIPFILPPFSTINAEHIVPAIRSVLNDCYVLIERTLSQCKCHPWENLIQPIAEINDRLNRIVSPIRHLNSVKNNVVFRKEYENISLLLSQYNSWLGQHKNLYNVYSNFKKNNKYYLLNDIQKKVIKNSLRDFRLSGILLNKEAKKRHTAIIVRLSELSLIYNNNVLDATMNWSKLVVNKDELLGVPEDILHLAKKYAETKIQNGWLITLDIPSYLPVMTYCDNSELREQLYLAYSTRASEQGPHAAKWDNSLVMIEILNLRYELAQLLGFNNYFDKSITTKMVKNKSQVINFLNELLKKVRPQAKKEFSELCSFVKTKFSVDNINPWDFAYYSEKYKYHLYKITNEELRPYFSENNVIKGLFKVIQLIYGLYVNERTNIDVYHEDVRFFELFDESQELRGSFYLDLYMRDYKRSGAWMDDCVNQMRKQDGSLQKPVAYLTCNFTPPMHNKPSLFSHHEVITLFHEFGHSLHHILTNIEIPEFSGINGVPWDAVEIPSQFMENWCWEPEVLKIISSHYVTGESLPKSLLDKLLLSKNYQSALSLLRQIEFSLFDFYLHTDFKPDKDNQIIELLYKIKQEIAIVPTKEWERFPHSFSHIFSGNYAAGYYSYLWSNVLSADAYSRFEEEGIFNRQTGQSFLDNFLVHGGSEDPIKLFKLFRNREPKIDSMLKHYGIQP